MSLAVSLQNILFRWPRSTRPVLDIDRLDVESGQHLFIQGASGSGKTTLLNLLTGINTPQRGALSVLGEDLCAMNSIQRDRFRADHLGVIFQQFNLLPFLSILDNVLLPCRFSQRRRELAGDLEQAAHQVLDELQISESLLGRDVMALSVGQQQRVAVARALIGNPQIVIADEPTSALDAANRDSFIDLLFSRATAHGSTLIFVSHDQQLASRFSHQINLAEINRAPLEQSA
jgi:putative ABC transport system ATP-binding protein